MSDLSLDFAILMKSMKYLYDHASDSSDRRVASRALARAGAYTRHNGLSSTVADTYGELGAAAAVAQIRKEGDLSVNTTVLLEALRSAQDAFVNKCADVLRAEQEIIKLKDTNDWRPISEAPKDGTRLELWLGTYASYGCYSHSTDQINGWTEHGYRCSPTHFRFPSSGPQT